MVIGFMAAIGFTAVICSSSPSSTPDRYLLAQGLAELTGGAGEQDFHGNNSSMC